MMSVASALVVATLSFGNWIIAEVTGTENITANNATTVGAICTVLILAIRAYRNERQEQREYSARDLKHQMEDLQKEAEVWKKRTVEVTKDQKAEIIKDLKEAAADRQKAIAVITRLAQNQEAISRNLTLLSKAVEQVGDGTVPEMEPMRTPPVKAVLPSKPAPEQPLRKLANTAEIILDPSQQQTLQKARDAARDANPTAPESTDAIS